MRKPFYTKVRDFSLMIALCMGAVILGLALTEAGAPDDTCICIYILSIVLTAALTSSSIYGVLASIIMSLSYSYFLVSPAMSFSRPSWFMVITTGMMLVISLMISSIMSRVRRGELAAKRREEENQVLYHLTKDLSGADSIEEVVELILKNMADVFDTDCRLLFFDEKGIPQETFTLMTNHTIQKNVPTNRNRDFLEYEKKPQEGYYYNASQHQYEWPLFSRNGKIRASMAIPESVASNFTQPEFRLVNTMGEASGIVIDKLMISKQQVQAELDIERERYRTNLLRSISHDLRTPLASIIGTTEILQSMLSQGSTEYELVTSIYKESTWLSTLVQNVLSLTRLQNKTMGLKKEVMVVEDVVNSAVETINLRLPERKIETQYPDDILTSSMDASLIKQVLINLMDNANKYSPTSEPIEITVDDDPSTHQIRISVADHGCGMSSEEKENAFKMFYTLKPKNTNSINGVGLGLPISESILKAHDGSIEVHDRPDGTQGSVFTIYLPKQDLNNE